MRLILSFNAHLGIAIPGILLPLFQALWLAGLVERSFVCGAKSRSGQAIHCAAALDQDAPPLVRGYAAVGAVGEGENIVKQMECRHG